jgi:hypothetical protein
MTCGRGKWNKSELGAIPPAVFALSPDNNTFRELRYDAL